MAGAVRRDRVDPVDRVSGFTLPQSYSAQHWQLTWVGFDILLLGFMIATAVLGFVQHHLLTLFAFTTGVLLVCDAWFDVLTARRGDFAVSILTAVLGELPIAVVLISGRFASRACRATPRPDQVAVPPPAAPVTFR